MTPDTLLMQLRDAGRIVDRTSCRIQYLPPVDCELVRTMIENEEELARIDPRKFEELVAALLLADGWEQVHLVPRLNAPGPDIIAFGLRSNPSQEKLIVECKRWERAVGLDVVRTVMYWADWEYHADSALIACTSRFTKSAVAQRDRFHRWNLSLEDRHSMQEWMATHLTSFIDTAISAESGLAVSELNSSVEALLLGHAPQQNSETVVRSVGVACQRCGGPVFCVTASTDAGALDYYRDFAHVCSDCRWSEYRMEKDPNLGGGPITSSYEWCPMCHRRYDDLL